MTNAYKELQAALGEDEKVEAVVFGKWAWAGFEQESRFIPQDKQGVPLTLEEAKPFMDGWTFTSISGTHAAYIWTNRRVILVTEYDGNASLSSVPRHPIAIMPDMLDG